MHEECISWKRRREKKKERENRRMRERIACRIQSVSCLVCLYFVTSSHPSFSFSLSPFFLSFVNSLSHPLILWLVNCIQIIYTEKLIISISPFFQGEYVCESCGTGTQNEMGRDRERGRTLKEKDEWERLRERKKWEVYSQILAIKKRLNKHLSEISFLSSYSFSLSFSSPLSPCSLFIATAHRLCHTLVLLLLLVKITKWLEGDGIIHKKDSDLFIG